MSTKANFSDVDLYVPTLTTLEKVYKATISGGVILVDDVRENHTLMVHMKPIINFVVKIISRKK